VTLQLLAQVGDKRQIGEIDVCSKGAAAREDVDELLRLETVERFPERGSSEPGASHEVGLDNRGTGRDVQADQQVAYRLIGEVSLVGTGIGGIRYGHGVAFWSPWMT
jgi:hypothetical protein